MKHFFLGNKWLEFMKNMHIKMMYVFDTVFNFYYVETV